MVSTLSVGRRWRRPRHRFHGSAICNINILPKWFYGFKYGSSSPSVFRFGFGGEKIMAEIFLNVDPTIFRKFFFFPNVRFWQTMAMKYFRQKFPIIWIVCFGRCPQQKSCHKKCFHFLPFLPQPHTPLRRQNDGNMRTCVCVRVCHRGNFQIYAFCASILSY